MSEPCLCGATDCKRCYPFSVYLERDYDDDFVFEKECEEQEDRRDHDREDKAFWAEVNK